MNRSTINLRIVKLTGHGLFNSGHVPDHDSGQVFDYDFDHVPDHVHDHDSGHIPDHDSGHLHYYDNFLLVLQVIVKIF